MRLTSASRADNQAMRPMTPRILRRELATVPSTYAGPLLKATEQNSKNNVKLKLEQKIRVVDFVLPY